MRAKVLKPFLYAHDGLSTVELSAGSQVDIKDDVAPGLVAERYITEIKATAEVVETTEEHPVKETGEAQLVEETTEAAPAPETGDGSVAPENKEIRPKRRGRG